MSETPQKRGLGAPIAAQVVGLLIAVVALGQVLTLAIAMLVPPPRPSIYRLSEIAAALNGQAVQPRDGAPLTRAMSVAPPALSGEEQAEFIDKVKQLAPQYRTELLPPKL